MNNDKEDGMPGRFAEMMRELRDSLSKPTWMEMSFVTRIPLPTLTRIARGTPPGYETVERIALAFPDYAPRIFKAAGKPIPAYLLAQNGILLRLAETSGADPERLRRAIAELIDGSEPAGGVKGIT